MKKPRRRPEGMSHSISCTDEQWEMMVKGARQAGMGTSAWFTQCALTLDPRSGRTFPLVLNEGQQHNLTRAVGRLVQPYTDRPESLSRLEDDVRYLLRKRVRAMKGQGRTKDAYAKLAEVFGDERADRIKEWALKEHKGA